MSTIAKPLVTAAYAANAETTIYTATGVRTSIDRVSVYNSDSVARTYTIKLVPSGSSAAATNVIVVKSLAAGETYTFPEVTGHVLEAGGFISELASAASVLVRRISGREIS